MQQHAQKTSRYAHLARLLLIAFSVSVFCVPQTLADSGTHTPLTWFGTDDSYDFISGGWLAENFSTRNPKAMPDYTVTSPAITEPSASESCAPVFHYLFAGGWYDLLNNDSFEGSSCTPNWVFPSGYTPSSSTICNSMPYPVYSKVVVLPTASGFYQDFFVPEDVTGPLEIALLFATVGTPSSSDKIILELREGGQLNELRYVPTASGPFSCRRVDITFANNQAGKSLRLRVRSAISTPGVQYHIEWIQIFGDL